MTNHNKKVLVHKRIQTTSQRGKICKIREDSGLYLFCTTLNLTLGLWQFVDQSELIWQTLDRMNLFNY